jgi:hypothetical protein
MATTAIVMILNDFLEPGGATGNTRPGDGVALLTDWTTRGSSGLPQFVQNFTASSFVLPHRGHSCTIFFLILVVSSGFINPLVVFL